MDGVASKLNQDDSLREKRHREYGRHKTETLSCGRAARIPKQQPQIFAHSPTHKATCTIPANSANR
jgi:hypothetical protein